MSSVFANEVVVHSDFELDCVTMKVVSNILAALFTYLRGAEYQKKTFIILHSGTPATKYDLENKHSKHYYFQLQALKKQNSLQRQMTLEIQTTRS